MKEIFLCLVLLTFISCKDKHEKGVQTDSSIRTTETTDNETDFYKDTAFFHRDNGDYHYKNIRYYFHYLMLSPIYSGELLIKETKEVKGSNQVDGELTIISLDIMTEENKIIGGKTFKEECDEAKLYSHFIETVKYPDPGGWYNIKLYKYDNFSSPFLTSDEQYWFFRMGSNSQNISKNSYFVTFEKFPNGYVFILRLSDMNGVLQEVKIKNANEANHEIDFFYPQIIFTSDNPFQYSNNTDPSNHCNAFSISPKDHLNLREHLTNSNFKLVFYDKQEKSDSLIVPIENGLLFGKANKVFDFEIYK